MHRAIATGLASLSLCTGCVAPDRAVIVIDQNEAVWIEHGRSARQKLRADDIGAVSVSAFRQKVAIVWEDHTCTIYPEWPDVQHSSALPTNALAAAWSSAGESLAVLCMPERPTARRALLRMYSSDMEATGEHVIFATVPDEARGLAGWTMVVSWSQDDRWIAISTARPHGISPAPCETVLLDLANGAQHYQPEITDWHFLDQRRLVAAVGPARDIGVFECFLPEKGQTAQAASTDLLHGDRFVYGRRSIAQNTRGFIGAYSVIAATDAPSGHALIWEVHPIVFAVPYRHEMSLRWLSGAPASTAKFTRGAVAAIVGGE